MRNEISGGKGWKEGGMEGGMEGGRQGRRKGGKESRTPGRGSTLSVKSWS